MRSIKITECGEYFFVHGLENVLDTIRPYPIFMSDYETIKAAQITENIVNPGSKKPDWLLFHAHKLKDIKSLVDTLNKIVPILVNDHQDPDGPPSRF